MAAVTPQPQSTDLPRTHEEILVLYGSQTGNSHAAASEIAASIPTQLSPSKIAEFDGPPNLTVTARLMQLDDFLEFEQGKWPRLFIIVTSSYGVGQASLGGTKFRDICEEWLEKNGYTDEPTENKMLTGISFAICGLGDSNYTTFFRNPTIIEDALTTMGATRVGQIGKADASGTGDDEQGKVIDRWIAGIWKELAVVVAKEPPSAEVMEEMHKQTWKFLLDMFKEWKPVNYKAFAILFFPATGVLAGLLAHFFYHVL